MSFAETRLDLGIDYGTRASLRFNTTVLVDGSGAEQRNANWSQPLGKWLIGDRSVSNSELDYFLDFHAARKGSYEGFRFKDWTDYHGLSQPIGTGDGSKTQFQLVKTYTVGNNSVKRPILKPIGSTVKIYLNGIPIIGGWSVDLTNGVITFTTAPNNGVAIAADFEFDVPVRFEQDKIDFRFDAYEVGRAQAIFQLQNLSLVETRLKPTINIPPSTVRLSIDEVLDLGYDYGTVGGPAYNTAIITVGAGYEKRTSNWSESRGKWQIGDRTLTRDELNYLIAFFRVTRGSASDFTYKDWQSNQNKQVRWESDSIEFRFDAIDLITQQAIFYLSGTSVIETLPSNVVGYSLHETTSSFLGTDSCYAISYNCSNGQAVPVVGSGGRYKTIAELEAALIPPPFTGGQCDGVLYRINIGSRVIQEYAPASYNSDTVIDVYGPIGAITTYVETHPHGGQNQCLGFLIPCRGFYSTPYSVRSSGCPDDGAQSEVREYRVYKHATGNTSQVVAHELRSIEIIRIDGQPDNCGNLPSSCPA